jgi:hypothetical protein
MRAYCVPDRYNYICTPESGPNDAQEFYLTRAGDGIMVRDRRRHGGIAWRDVRE